jgi:hypothetical protein
MDKCRGQTILPSSSLHMSAAAANRVRWCEQQRIPVLAPE